MSQQFISRWKAALEQQVRPECWTGIEELLAQRAPEQGEFPVGADDAPGGLSRRHFLSLLGASAALAGLGGCTRAPDERIVPYVRTPPDVVPTQALHYATSMLQDGFAVGLVVQAREGRPIKVEGNPEHPASLGASGAWQQALLLQLYDPQRARAVRFRGAPRTYDHFLDAFAPGRAPIGEGHRMRLLLEPTTSPLVLDQLARLKERYPGLRVHFHAPLAATAPVEALRQLTGRALQPRCDLQRAEVVVSLGANPLGDEPYALRHARDFAERRRLVSADAGMNRLYVVEAALSVTGSLADHRLARRPSELPAFAARLVTELQQLGRGVPGLSASLQKAIDGLGAPAAGEEVRAMARDLAAHPGACVVAAGAHEPALVQVLALLANVALGNVGETMLLTETPLAAAPWAGEDLGTLADEMRAGAVDRLLVLGGNPAYTAPADLDFGALLGQVPDAAYLGLFENETSQRAGWFLPESHPLESWGDGRAYDGTVSFVQPLVSPLYGGHTVSEVLAALLGEGRTGAHDLLRAFWRRQLGAAFDDRWDDALQRGILPGTAATTVTPPLRFEPLAALLAGWKRPESPGLEVQWRADYRVHDGRFANNAWLQELPDPITKLTWGNAAQISPRTAAGMGVETGRRLRITRGSRALEIPAIVVPGHADESVTLPLGYGRAPVSGGEALAAGVGANAYALWTREVEGHAALARAEALPGTELLAITQAHWRMEGRPVAIARTLDEERAAPRVETMKKPLLSLYDADRPPEAPQWGMVVDLSVCTGCSACVVACQAENNIPVVGREGVLQSREMHWLRIDRYFTGSPEHPGVITQPMLCQHCEKAPCEYVCPTYATTHSPDGLNEMTYNRCVGTRFCQNNCPYKVRRFNWFDYNARKPPTLKMAMNPEVTVRGRGVIEKCTFCVQRIRTAQQQAAVEGRARDDVRVQTACQQACPTGAIVFGDVSKPESDVSRRQALPRAYQLLEELGTRPRVHYLARVLNRNGEMG